MVWLNLRPFRTPMFGGSNGEDLGENSKSYDFLIDQGVSRSQALDFSSTLPLYWGNQPIVAGPAYIGAIMFFLFILGLIFGQGQNQMVAFGWGFDVFISLMGKEFRPTDRYYD